MSSPKMKVRIWSDVMCPFCYIGKHHYEAALAEFADKDFIETEWQSFQLDPEFPTGKDKNGSTKEYLMTRKGISEEQVDLMQDHVERMGRESGLDFYLNQSIMANSFDAHRLIQLAKTKGLDNVMEEKLFAAHFTSGEDVGDHDILKRLGTEAGLAGEEIEQALTDDRYAYLVNQDKRESEQLGIRGVPFFVLNNRYAISGAQPKEAILQTLEKAFGEWRKDNPVLQMEVSEGPACTPDGVCD